MLFRWHICRRPRYRGRLRMRFAVWLSTRPVDCRSTALMSFVGWFEWPHGYSITRQSVRHERNRRSFCLLFGSEQHVSLTNPAKSRHELQAANFDNVHSPHCSCRCCHIAGRVFLDSAGSFGRRICRPSSIRRRNEGKSLPRGVSGRRSGPGRSLVKCQSQTGWAGFSFLRPS